MTAGRDDCAGVDRQLVRDRGARVTGAANLPAANIDRSVAVVIEFDELIVSPIRSARAELADYDERGR